jgi:hypothetical protein
MPLSPLVVEGYGYSRRDSRRRAWSVVTFAAMVVLASFGSWTWHHSTFALEGAAGFGLVLVAWFSLFGQPSVRQSLLAPFLFALGVAVSYPAAEWLLFRFVSVARYQVTDRLFLETPLFVLLLWVFAIFLLAFLAFQLRNVLAVRSWWLLALATGLLAALVGPAFETVGQISGLWLITPSSLVLGYVPLYIFLGYFFTFLLLPWLQRGLFWGGIATSAILAVEWIAFHRLVELAGSLLARG